MCEVPLQKVSTLPRQSKLLRTNQAHNSLLLSCLMLAAPTAKCASPEPLLMLPVRTTRMKRESDTRSRRCRFIGSVDWCAAAESKAC